MTLTSLMLSGKPIKMQVLAVLSALTVSHTIGLLSIGGNCVIVIRHEVNNGRTIGIESEAKPWLIS